jgi:aminoglycoside phosphotransferase (APT) family kinase protein
MRQPRGAAVSVRLHDRDWMAGALEKLEQYHKQFPACLIHGDTHLGNLYLEADGTPGFFDAQVCRGPWQMEVNYHLIVACDIADRRTWEGPLIARYLEQLKQNGVAAPNFEEAWETYRRETAYGYFIFVINESIFQSESVNTAEAARFGAAALDHGTIGLL